MLKVVKIGDWTRVGQLLSGAPQRVQAAIDKAMRKEGHFLRTKIVEGIREQAPGGRAFAPLAPTTLAIRRFRGFGGTKALIAGGDLRNSITVTREGDQVFVGVHRTAPDRQDAHRAVGRRHRHRRAARARLAADRHEAHAQGPRVSARRVSQGRPRRTARRSAVDRDCCDPGASSTHPRSRVREVRETRGGFATVPHARCEEPGG
jgi:hypothetical protein